MVGQDSNFWLIPFVVSVRQLLTGRGTHTEETLLLTIRSVKILKCSQIRCWWGRGGRMSALAASTIIDGVCPQDPVTLLLSTLEKPWTCMCTQGMYENISFWKTPEWARSMCALNKSLRHQVRERQVAEWHIQKMEFYLSFVRFSRCIHLYTHFSVCLCNFYFYLHILDIF